MAKKPAPPKTEEELAADVEFHNPPGFGGVYEDFTVARAASIWETNDTGHDLTIEEQLFCRSYIVDRNPIAALRRLNYSYDLPRLKAISKKFLENPEVMACVATLAQRMMDHLEITAERVQRQIASVAFFDPREVMQFDQFGAKVIHSKFWTDSQIAAVQSVKMTQNGIEIKLYDRLRAVEMLAKQTGLQKDDNDLSETLRVAAEGVMEKVGRLFDRTYPEEEPARVLEDKTKH